MIIALYKSTFAIPYHTKGHMEKRSGERPVDRRFEAGYSGGRYRKTELDGAMWSASDSSKKVN